jgi:hypothetical protein
VSDRETDRVFKVTGLDFEGRTGAVAEFCHVQQVCGIAFHSKKLYAVSGLGALQAIKVYNSQDASMLQLLPVPNSTRLHSLAVNEESIFVSDF